MHNLNAKQLITAKVAGTLANHDQSDCALVRATGSKLHYFTETHKQFGLTGDQSRSIAWGWDEVRFNGKHHSEWYGTQPYTSDPEYVCLGADLYRMVFPNV